MPYIPEAARPAVRRSVLLQFAVYAAAAVVAIRYPAPVLLYWLVPLLLGYPFLLIVLMAEHAGCAENGDNYANTRTTYTWWPLRLIFWNMSYHAEHHVNPAIPFHALPAAHQVMKSRVTHISSGGYISWCRGYIRKLSAG
jgi:fatty acid desaturase